MVALYVPSQRHRTAYPRSEIRGLMETAAYAFVLSTLKEVRL
jgi:hypothetical protein